MSVIAGAIDAHLQANRAETGALPTFRAWARRWVLAGPRWFFRLWGIDPYPLILSPVTEGFHCVDGQYARDLGLVGAPDAGPLGRGHNRERRLCRRINDHAGPVWLAVDPDRALIRRIALPETALADLRAILAFEIERITPFSAAEVIYGAHIVGPHDDEANTVEVDVAIVQAQDVEAHIASLRLAGIETDGAVVISAAEAETAVAIPVPFQETVADGATGMGWRNAALVFLLVLLLGLGLWLPYAHLTQQVAAGQAALAVDRPAVNRFLAAREDREKSEQGAQQFLQQQTDSPAVVLIWETVTKLLPDDTWLTAMRFGEGFVDISGSTAAAADLVAVLEADSLFSRVEFAAPVTTEPISRRERFQFRLSLAEVTP